MVKALSLKISQNVKIVYMAKFGGSVNLLSWNNLHFKMKKYFHEKLP